MKLSRITAFITAAALAVPFAACSIKINAGSSSETTTASETSTAAPSTEAVSADNPNQISSPYSQYDPVDTDLIREHAEKLLADIKIADNSDAVREDIDVLIDDTDAAVESSSRAQVHYCLNFSDEDAEAAYDEVSEEAYIALQFARYAFAHCWNSEYKDLVKDHVDEKSLDYYTYPNLSIKRLEGYSRVDYSLSDEYTDRYYDIVNKVSEIDEDDEDALEDIKLEAAELYLEIMKDISAEDFYANYNRDYSPELVFDLADTAYTQITQISDKFVQAYVAAGGADDDGTVPEELADTFAAIQKYASKLSPEIGKAADQLVNEKQYIITNDENAYPGCATISLPHSHTAAIFVNNADETAFFSAVHEFGHYYATQNFKTHAVDSLTNMDVAEIQSQAIEFLFTRFYEDFYGDLADAKRVEDLSSALNTILAAFVVGKFEYSVLKDVSTLEPQDVIDIWDECLNGLSDTEFYMIPHIFERPGYYISYAVSGLAALQIWRESISDPAGALTMYNKIAKIDADSPDTQFQKTLSACGMDNVLTKSYIVSITDSLEEYLDSIIENE